MKIEDLETLPRTDRQIIEALDVAFPASDTTEALGQLAFTLLQLDQAETPSKTFSTMIGKLGRDAKWAYCRYLAEQLFQIDLG